MIVHEVDRHFLTLSRVTFHSMVLRKAMNVLRSKFIRLGLFLWMILHAK